MTVFEVLKLNKDLLFYCKKLGIRVDDVIYLDLFQDYCQMGGQGFKVSYIVASLAEKYHVSERKVYSLIKRFQTDCKLFAV